MHFTTLLFSSKCLLCACSLCTIVPTHTSRFLSKKQGKIVKVLLLGLHEKLLFPANEIKNIISE